MSQFTMLDEQIVSIISIQKIREQSELQVALKSRGYDVPQATLSRRLKKLQIVKISGVYTITQTMQRPVATVLNIQVSEYGLIVLHTHPGQASSLAYFLDQKYVNFSISGQLKTGILGTIAGDDTVVLIAKNKASIPVVCGLLREDFPYVIQVLP